MATTRVRQGGRYRARVNGEMTTVRVILVKHTNTSSGRVATTYTVVDEATGKEYAFHTNRRFGKEVVNESEEAGGELGPTACPVCGGTEFVDVESDPDGTTVIRCDRCPGPTEGEQSADPTDVSSATAPPTSSSTVPGAGPGRGTLGGRLRRRLASALGEDRRSAEETEFVNAPDPDEERLVKDIRRLEDQAGTTLDAVADRLATAGERSEDVTAAADPIPKPQRDEWAESAERHGPPYSEYPPPAEAPPVVPAPPALPSVEERVTSKLRALSDSLSRLATPHAHPSSQRERERHEQAAVAVPQPGLPGTQGGPLSGHVRRSDEHLIVRARAGTGKTTTLVEGIKRVMGIKSDLVPSEQQAAVWELMARSAGVRSVGFCAFNSSIAGELRKRVPPGCDAATMHSMGFKAVSRCFGLSGRDATNKHKVTELTAELLNQDLRDLRRLRPTLCTAVGNVVKLCKMRLVGVNEANEFDSTTTDWYTQINRIVDHYDLDVSEADEEDLYHLVPAVMERCLDPRRDGCVDFDDQIWLAVVTRGIRLWRYDLLCVDEGQDLNPAQQRLVRKAAELLVVCGDDRQAIYGFTGADVEGLPTMERTLGATDRGCTLLPLTVTRRCGKAIVEEARKLVPDFEAHPSTGPGRVGQGVYPLQQNDNYWTGAGTTKRLPWDDTYLKDVAPGDLVLCRVNSHLVLQCAEHHKRGKRASILGRSVGDQIVEFVKKLDAGSLPDLLAKVTDWRAAELAKENAKRTPSDNRILNIETRADTVLAVASGCPSVPEFYAKVDSLFTDDPSQPGVLHASIHKAKGLEARNVWFLMPKGASCPHPMAKASWQQQQEWNLKYVGITRAIETMTYVS